jgi:lipopolysaccharide export system permease protein
VGRIDRYILREITIPFLFSIGFVVLVVFLIQMQRIASAAVGFGLTGSDVVVIFLAALPPFLVLAVPIAYMMSILIGMGRIAQDLELVALKSAGMSPLRLARGPIIFGALISVLCVPLAVHGEPYGLNLLYERLVDVGLRNITSAIRPGVFNTGFQRIALYARSRDANGTLLDVLVSDERDPKQPIMLTAARGRLVPRGAQDLTLNLENGEIHLGLGTTQEKYDLVRFNQASIGIDAAQELKERTRFVSELGRLSSKQMLQRVAKLGPNNRLGRRIEKTYWRRFAFPAMAFVFGVLGIAIILTGGPTARARNAIWALGGVVIYYVLTRVGDYAVVQYPGTAFWAAFGPNLFVFCVGMVILLRSGRAR